MKFQNVKKYVKFDLLKVTISLPVEGQGHETSTGILGDIYVHYIHQPYDVLSSVRVLDQSVYKYPKFNLYKVTIGLPLEGLSHRTMCFETLPISPHIPNSNALHKIFLSYCI